MTSGFVKAEVVEQATIYHLAQSPTGNMTPLVNDIELSIPQGAPLTYLTEHIAALPNQSDGGKRQDLPPNYLIAYQRHRPIALDTLALHYFLEP